MKTLTVNRQAHALQPPAPLFRMKTKLILPILTLLVTLVGASTASATITTNFTSAGTFTWTAPAGVTAVTVQTWGGGGKGGTRTTTYTGGGGGGGAYSIKNSVSVTPGTGYTVVVGAGATTTAAGGDSYFINTSTVLAKGGSSVANNTTTGAAGGVASSGVGDTKYSGGTGANANNTGSTYGGGGGSSAGTAANGNYTTSTTSATGATAPTGGGDGGDGFSTVSATGDGSPGSAPGGGGGGGKNFGSTGNGGSGADGQVSITYTPPTTTVGTATATAASQTSILVAMPYTDDANGNNTYTVEYKFSSGSTWTTWVANAAHTASPYTTTITGLTPGGTYDVRVTYNDADGVTGTNPQTISSVTTTANGITALQAWSNIYHGTSTSAQNITYTVPAGSGSQRVLVVAIASSQTATGNARSVTLTYGGQTMTPAVDGDMGTSTVRQHTALYYLNEAGLEAATSTTLSVTVSGGTTRITDVFAAVYDGVDQTTPITDHKTYSSGTSAATTFALSTGLAVGAGDKAIEIISSVDSGSTTVRTVSTYATSWTTAGVDQTYNTTDGVRDLITTRTVPSSNVAADTTSTTMSGSSLGSMTAMSIGNLKATPAVIWPTASGITYGQALSASTLSGGESAVAGAFTFTTPSTTPGAGTYSASVTFTPTDTTDYNTVTGTVTVAVAKATPTLSLATSSVIANGSPQSATVNSSTPGVVSNVKYNGSATVPTAAATNAITADFAPTDNTDYNSLTGASAGNFAINPAALSQLVMNPTTIASATAGTSVSGSFVSITAKDAYGNVCSNGPNAFIGTVAFGGTAGATGTSAAFTAGVLTTFPTLTPTSAGSSKTITATSGRWQARRLSPRSIRARLPATR